MRYELRNLRSGRELMVEGVLEKGVSFHLDVTAPYRKYAQPPVTPRIKNATI